MSGDLLCVSFGIRGVAQQQGRKVGFGKRRVLVVFNIVAVFVTGVAGRFGVSVDRVNIVIRIHTAFAAEGLVGETHHRLRSRVSKHFYGTFVSAYCFLAATVLGVQPRHSR